MWKVGINRAAVITRKTPIPRKNGREGMRSTVLTLSAIRDSAPQGSDQWELWELPKPEGAPSRHNRRECPPICYCCSWSSHFPEDWGNNLSLPGPQIIPRYQMLVGTSLFSHWPVLLKVDSQDHLQYNRLGNVYMQILTHSPITTTQQESLELGAFMFKKPQKILMRSTNNTSGLFFKCL